MLVRIITSFFLICIGAFVITYGKLPLMLWILLVSLLIAFEIFSLLRKNNYHPPFIFPAYLLITGLVIASYLEETQKYWHSIPVITIIVLGFIFFLTELFLKKIYVSKKNPLTTLRIILLSGATLSYVNLLRSTEHGLINTWFILISIWASDVFAYYGGKLFGKHPLSSLSPKKTIEGSISGIVGALYCAIIFSLILKLDYLIYSFLAIAIAVIAQIGDLHESLTKRELKTKDSSNLLPGHGGFYDRADSNLFVFPIFYYLFYFIL